MSKSPKGAFTHQWQAIKSFITFRVSSKPTAYQKRKVREHYKLIYGYRQADGTTVPGLYNPRTDVPVSSKSEKRLRAIMEAEGQEYHKGIKVAFVESVHNPLDPSKLLKPRLKYKKGEVSKTTFDVTQRFYPFKNEFKRRKHETRELRDVVDKWADDEIERILSLAPHVKNWVVKVGKRQTGNPRSRRGIAEYLKYLCFTYKNSGEWLRGLIAFEFHNTASLQKLLASRSLARKGARGKRKKNRRGH